MLFFHKESSNVSGPNLLINLTDSLVQLCAVNNLDTNSNNLHLHFCVTQIKFKEWNKRETAKSILPLSKLEVNVTQCFEPLVSNWLSPAPSHYSSGQPRMLDHAERQSA